MSARYTAQRIDKEGIEIVQLADTVAGVSASIVPSHGNIAFELLQGGHNWLWNPFLSPAEMPGQTTLFGVPLLSPWANRLSSDTYLVNGAEYTLNRQLGNLRLDKNHLAIHGLVLFADWTVVSLQASDDSATVTSSLNFAKQPRWMAHFPFAHSLELTHTVAEGRLHVLLRIANESAEPMPVSVGFHPYFTLPESSREEWKVRLPARTHLLLTDAQIPSGKTEPVMTMGPFPLANLEFDDVYTDLERDPGGETVFSAQTATESVEVGFGETFPVAVVYAPANKNFICFEPMAAPTDVLHLVPAGKARDLQRIPPGEVWTGEFWIKPSRT